MKLSRRRMLALLGTGAAAGGAGLYLGHREDARSHIQGKIVGASQVVGHRLRQGNLPAPTATTSVPVLIVGGGISGLAAGWKLSRLGFHDYLVLDLEPKVGGTATSGETAVSAYPWGAHYVPMPGKSATLVRELFHELGVIERFAPDGTAIFNERHVCFAPQERLFIHGRWQEGLFPSLGATKRDFDQYRAFLAAMSRFREAKGKDGRRAFDLPMEQSSRDPEFLQLDNISMAAFLISKGFDSPRLHWFLEYGCRDDYGCDLATTSAWAGIHYFAARPAGESGQVLTWPAGNGWIVKQLEQRVTGRIRTGCLVFRVQPDAKDVAVDVWDPEGDRTTRYLAREVILAVPKFIVARLLGTPTPPGYTYSPWMVANLHVDRLPSGRGVPAGWDNVIYDSPGLGYVVGTHQHLSSYTTASVLTYYRPYASADPVKERQRMLSTTWAQWRDVALDDLSRAHPDIQTRVQRLDVMVWGHAMVRPAVGFIWGGQREKALVGAPHLHLAHCDSSGLPLFEEALYRGVTAAVAARAVL